MEQNETRNNFEDDYDETINLNWLSKELNRYADEKGWNKDYSIQEKLLLLHSEISEAVEELRSGHKVDYVYYRDSDGKPEGFGIELADLFIRALHLIGKEGIDIDGMMKEKILFNRGRPYRHGKKF